MLSIVLTYVYAMLTPMAHASNANPCPPGFTGETRAIVTYSPSTNADQALAHFPDHLKFLEKHMKSGDLISSGPMVKDGKPIGKGFGVYRLADVEKVKAIVDQDPMITGKVSAYEINQWLECKLAQAKKK